MSIIADILLVAAALGATFYCVVLSRRLNRFNDLETGVGGAIAVLSAQVDDMTRTLQSAQGAASASAMSLGDLTSRAEGAARRLELLVASMHDLPGTPSGPRDRPASAPASAPAQPPRGEDRLETRAAPLPLTNPVSPAPRTDDTAGYEPVPMAALFASRRGAAGAA